jgi:membrane fusion protein, heavy metal efflux system
MNDQQAHTGVLESPPTAPQQPLGRPGRRVGQLLPTALALACVAGLVYVGQTTGWNLPKFSVLLGREQGEKDDWCAEHSVPDSVCVECRKVGLPGDRDFGWCRTHGVHQCPLEHPEVAELKRPPAVTAEDFARAARALAFAPRPENNSKCKLQQRRIQFASAESAARLGVEVRPAARTAVTEAVSANGEIVYDATRVARLSSRVPGTVWRVEKQVGDRVRRGDVLAVVDAAEVGRAKAEFQQAMTQAELKAQTLARLQELAGRSVSGQSLQAAEAALEEARVRLLTAEQALRNLGLSARAADYQGLPPEEIARRLQFLGLPDALARTFDPRTASSNLLAVRSPLDGEVVARSAVAREQADASRVLFIVADAQRMWLMLNVRLEDAGLLRPGLAVRFRHEGHGGWDEGTVAWVSPAADEKTRTVPVRVELPNAHGRHHARTFGTARVILREEPNAIVVPSEAVHWDGDCNVVFVRDRHFDAPGAPKVFHVRKVRPGAKDGLNTEIIAGVLPGELVATRGSGILRAELLKNNLGEG